MGLTTWQPHETVLVTIYPDGQERSATTTIPSVVFADGSKIINEKPPFVPGVFNVKNYSVSRTSSYGTASEQVYRSSLGGTLTFKQIFKLKDGCRQESWNGYLLNRKPPSFIQHEQLALQEAYAKLNEAVWDAGIDLAEIGGTFLLIKDGLKLLASPTKVPQLIKNLREFKPQGKHEYGWKEIRRHGEKGVKAAADSWLTWRYGIMPLVLSIQDALEALEKQLEKASRVIRTKRRRPALEPTKTEKKGAAKYMANYVFQYAPRVEAIVYYRRLLDQTLEQLLGLTPERIPEALWEVTTLSFVWDWFFNVGSLLGSLRPKVGIEVLGSSTSCKVEERHSIIQLFSTHDGKRKYEAPPFHVSTDSFKRTVTTAYALPVFTGVDGMSLQRYIDAAALMLNPTLKTLKKNASLFGR